MIKITKPQAAPAILRTKGKTKRAAHCRSYSQHQAEYQSGQRAFPFDAKIYAHADVKTALIEAQHGKCCFCEAKVGADGDVEHFRPKSASCQGLKQGLIRPGYYWLAYEWNNLLLSCSACNQRHKGNLFPLATPTSRARSHHDAVAQEDPLLLNPDMQDPEQYIAFRHEIPYPIKNNRCGKTTIEVLALDRENLNERRREHLARLMRLQEFVVLAAERPADKELQKVADDARLLLDHDLRDNAEFAAMARSAKANDFYI